MKLMISQSLESDGEYEVIEDWPNCSVPDCPNKCCLSLNSDKCHPHTVSLLMLDAPCLLPNRASKVNRKEEGE